ncbi:MAG: hypothetical protein AB1547_14390 [Thermodesulfobacteriota bacterium]
MAHLTESEIEYAAIGWLADLGHQTLFGPKIVGSDGRVRSTFH